MRRCLAVTCLWMLVILLGVGGCRSEQARPAPVALSGTPSWLPIGPEVYQEKDRAEAETRVLTVRNDCSRWFLGYSKSVSKEEYDAYVEEQRRHGALVSMQSHVGGHYLPTMPPYPQRVEDIPVEDQGVKLTLAARASDDLSHVLLTLKLTSQTRPVEREVEHRCTNTLPFLFAFYVDGKAVQVRVTSLDKMGGAHALAPLVAAGGERDWLVKVDAASLRGLLPDGRPHELAAVAAFSDRQHVGYVGDSERAMRLVGGVFLGREGSKQIVVRSEVARLQWTGERWIAAGLAGVEAAPGGAKAAVKEKRRCDTRGSPFAPA